MLSDRVIDWLAMAVGSFVAILWMASFIGGLKALFG